MESYAEAQGPHGVGVTYMCKPAWGDAWGCLHGVSPGVSTYPRMHATYAANSRRHSQDACHACCCACRNGEVFQRGKHEAGTEIKAITYSAMQIRQQNDEVEVFIIVDI